MMVLVSHLISGSNTWALRIWSWCDCQLKRISASFENLYRQITRWCCQLFASIELRLSERKRAHDQNMSRIAFDWARLVHCCCYCLIVIKVERKSLNQQQQQRRRRQQWTKKLCSVAHAYFHRHRKTSNKASSTFWLECTFQYNPKW